MIKLFKYLFLPYLLIILYAASLGRESAPPNLLKEYFIFMSLLIVYDVISYAIRAYLLCNNNIVKKIRFRV